MLAPPGDVHVRPTVPRDHRAVAKVVYRSWLATYRPFFGARRINELFAGTLPCSLDWLAERAEEIGSWVATREDEVVGSAGLHLRKDGDAELSHLYVLREHQGVGVGSALLAICRHELRLRACPSLRIWVLERTPAVAFYRRHGARVVGRALTVVGSAAEPTLELRIDIA